MGKYNINKKQLLKEECLKYLGGKKCADCGIDYLPACCYDFHHKTGDKEFNISKYGKFDATLKKELDKCKIDCVICHRMITNKIPMFNWRN